MMEGCKEKTALANLLDIAHPTFIGGVWVKIAQLSMEMQLKLTLRSIALATSHIDLKQLSLIVCLQ